MADTYTKPRRYRWMKRAYALFAHTFCLSVAVSCIFPLVWMLSSSFKTQEMVFSDMSIIPKTFEWSNYYIAWTKGHFGAYFFNSLLYTVIVVAGVIIVSSMAAYAFSRLKFPGKDIFFILLIATMMIPIPGAFIALYVLLTKLGTIPYIGPYIGIDSRLGYMLPQINGGLALGIFLMKTFFDKLPRDLEDAALIDGCNKFQVYRHVALPLAKPAIAVLIIFNSLTVWNEYLFAMLVLNTPSLMPLQRGLMNFQGQHITQYPVLMAGITITIIPIVVLYLVMQRNIIAGITAGAIRS